MVVIILCTNADLVRILLHHKEKCSVEQVNVSQDLRWKGAKKMSSLAKIGSSNLNSNEIKLTKTKESFILVWNAKSFFLKQKLSEFNVFVLSMRQTMFFSQKIYFVLFNHYSVFSTFSTCQLCRKFLKGLNTSLDSSRIGLCRNGWMSFRTLKELLRCNSTI